jgi:hypothetical protein
VRGVISSKAAHDVLGIFTSQGKMADAAIVLNQFADAADDQVAGYLFTNFAQSQYQGSRGV